MFRCNEVHVHKKVVIRQPQRISIVPRPFGVLTQPSVGKDVVLVELTADSSVRCDEGSRNWFVMGLHALYFRYDRIEIRLIRPSIIVVEVSRLIVVKMR